MEKFLKGKCYESIYNKAVVICLEDSITKCFFKGVVIAQYLSNYELGHISNMWSKNSFREIDYKGDIILGNNGWTKIESEEDLPTIDCEDGYIIGRMFLNGNFTEFENKVSDSGVKYNYKHNNITHYKKYIKLIPNF